MAEKKRLKDLTFWDKIYIPAILKGLALTFKNLLGPKFTLKYPEKNIFRKVPIAVVLF